MSTGRRFGLEIDRGHSVWVRTERSGGIDHVMAHGVGTPFSPAEAFELFVKEADPGDDPVVVALSHPSVRLKALTISHSSDIDDYVRRALIEKAGEEAFVAGGDIATVAILDAAASAEFVAHDRPGSLAAREHSEAKHFAAAFIDARKAELDDLLAAIADSGIDARVTLSPVVASREGFHLALRFAEVEMIYVENGIPREALISGWDVTDMLDKTHAQRAREWAQEMANNVDRFMRSQHGTRYSMDNSATGLALYGAGARVPGLRQALESRVISASEGMPALGIDIANEPVDDNPLFSFPAFIGTAAAAAVFERPDLAYFPNPYIEEREYAAARRRYRIIGGGILAAGALATAAAVLLPTHGTSSQLATAEQQLARLTQQQNVLAPAISVQHFVSAESRQVRTTLAAQPDLTATLRSVEKSLPRGAKLTSVQLQPANNLVQVTVSVSVPSVGDLISWEQDIEAEKGVTGFFSSSENVSTTGVTTTVSWNVPVLHYPKSSDRLPNATLPSLPTTHVSTSGTRGGSAKNVGKKGSTRAGRKSPSRSTTSTTAKG